MMNDAQRYPASPQISLIICTRNRADGLRSCLEYVKKLEFPLASEIVIVDNGSTDHTQEVLRHFRNEMNNVPVHIVEQSAPGLSNARNAGVARANGEIIAFTDDDCYPSPDFLTQIQKAFADSRVGYVTGRILLHDPTDYRPQSMSLRYPWCFTRDHSCRLGP